MKFISLLLGVLFSLNAIADCDSVIALSKTVSSNYSNKETFEQQANNFCKEYSESKSSGKSMAGGGSYGLFSASVGMSNQDASAIASKYCSSSSAGAASSSAYKSYVEFISPDAYSSYNQCIALSQKNVRFNVDSAAVLPNQFSISVSFISPYGLAPEAQIDISSSDGVTCSSGGTNVSSVTVKTGTTASINCRRADRAEPAFIKFVDKNDGRADSLTIPWQRYDAQGNPVNTLLALEKRTAELEGRMVASGTISMKAVNTRAIQDASICPGNEKGDAFRGELNGRVQFDKNFVRTPTVNIGLNSIDIGEDSHGQRLTIVISRVDTAGFNYTFMTWCNTAIAGAQANWIAVSP